MYYHDSVVRFLVICSLAWTVLGMSAGVYVAAELIWPEIDFGRSWLSFGRLRALHTNAVIFGFGVSALMATGFYSVQRTCHIPLPTPRLAWFTAILWQLGVLAGYGKSVDAGRGGIAERQCSLLSRVACRIYFNGVRLTMDVTNLWRT